MEGQRHIRYVQVAFMFLKSLTSASVFFEKRRHFGYIWTLNATKMCDKETMTMEINITNLTTDNPGLTKQIWNEHYKVLCTFNLKFPWRKSSTHILSVLDDAAPALLCMLNSKWRFENNMKMKRNHHFIWWNKVKKNCRYERK